MRIACLQFNPGLWPTVGVLMIVPLFVCLGCWQLDRAQQKRVLKDEFERRQVAATIDLNAVSNVSEQLVELNWRKVKVQGEFSKDINILLDNQVVNGIAGYFVYTPFRLQGYNVWVLVNRGWISLGPHRDHVPDMQVDSLQQVVSIQGHVKVPPRTGILLADNDIEQLGEGVYRIQKLSLVDIESFTQWQFLPYVIRLSPESVGGFAKILTILDIGYQRHFGYAFQWFAMALAVVVIYLVLNVSRVE